MELGNLIVAIIVIVLVLALVYWITSLPGLGIEPPVRSILMIVVVLILVLWLLGRTGYLRVSTVDPTFQALAAIEGHSGRGRSIT